MKRELTIKSLLNSDPDVEMIEIKVTLKEGKGQVSSFTVERATMQWLVEHTPSWVDYCVANKEQFL